MAGAARQISRALPPHEAQFYASQSPASDLGGWKGLKGYSQDVSTLAAAVRGLLISKEESAVRRNQVPSDREDSQGSLSASELLHDLEGWRTSSSYEEERYVGTGRDFALLLCGFSRELGIPARVRCGYATYLLPGFHQEHWVAEYWHPDFGWCLADARELANHENIRLSHTGFDPMRVPRDDFIVAGEAWQGYRQGDFTASGFGVSPDIAGVGHVRSSVLRDLAALNKIEVGATDTWDFPDGDEELLDTVAQIESRGGDLEEIRGLYADHPSLQVPPRFTRL
ncbi:transglutaminase-like domain-containing protein [Streptomyces phaeochromogenes]